MNEDPLVWEPAADDELWGLISAFCDGSLTIDERDRLEARLRGDAAAKSFFLRFMRVHASLQLQSRRQPLSFADSILQTGMPAQDSASPVMPAWSGLFRLNRDNVFWLMTGVIVASWVAFLAVVVRPDFSSTHRAIVTNTQTTKQQRPKVAVLRRTVDCVWTTDTKHTDEGTSLRAGDTLGIITGFAEVAFDSGTRMVMRGPARLTIEDSNSGYLAAGDITARVPEKALGFTVGTPHGRIVDMGTEFAVQVRDEEAEVHVFQGMVKADWSSVAGPETRDLEIRAGESVRLDVEAKALVEPKTSSDSFVRVVEFDAMQPRPSASSEARKRFQHYCDAVVRDDQLMLFFPIDRQSEQARRLINCAPTAEPGSLTDADVPESVRWVNGRLPCKPALAFDGKTKIELGTALGDAIGETAELSLAIWYRPGSIADARGIFQLGIAADDRSDFAIDLPGANANFTIGVPAETRVFYGSYVGRPFLSRAGGGTGGGWHHIVGVYRGNAQRDHITMYFDGALVGTLDSPGKLNFKGAPLRLGTFLRSDYEADFFDGCLDELLVTKRALTSSEVAWLYEFGKEIANE